MQDEFQCACAAARKAARVVTQLYDSYLRSAGLEAPQFALLMTLQQYGPCTQADLGRRYALDKTTISRNLKLMERNGWIQPSTESVKGRRQLMLTALGRERLAVAEPEWKKAQEQLQSGMSLTQWNDMFQTLQTVIAAAQSKDTACLISGNGIGH